MAALRRAVGWYDARLRSAPLRTKVLTSFTILTSVRTHSEHRPATLQTPVWGWGGGAQGAC